MAVSSTFLPYYNSGVTVTPTTISATQAVGVGAKALVLTNLSPTVTVYVRVGLEGIVATTADFPVLPNNRICIAKDHDHTTVAFLAPAGPGSLHIIPGEGFLS